MNALMNNALTMTSREIAELTGKLHKHVLRDIDTLLETIGPDLGLGFKSSTYTDASGREYRQFILDRDSTYCLVAGYDATTRMRIIKRWQELEQRIIQPSGLFTTEQRAFELSESCYRLAQLYGFEGNQAILSADKAVKSITGVSPLTLMGHTHLVASQQARIYTPTELGKMAIPVLSAQKINKLLEASGLQLSNVKGEWVPTESAADRYQLLDTGKKHSDGTPVKQIKWYASILDRIGIVWSEAA